MSKYENLIQAIACLSKNIYNFPIGAVSIEDFKPIEEKIKTTRESLKHLNAKLLLLKAQDEYKRNEESEEETENIVTNLHEATANSLINKAAIKLCLHSYGIQAILTGEEGDHDMQKKIYACMCKLFVLNDNILTIEKEIENALKKQLELKIQCRNALFEYKDFLKEQEELRNKRLEETNPQHAINKERINKTIEKINMMKKLIVNFIAASSHMLNEPFYVQMLEDHRELVNFETILKISQNSEITNENS
ncbi:uncharacterized protein LOC122719152 [Apis laboriosa]|uniref:uncharacterized protein LOC122719152 n=1 Tax=Apis laboriosa TaxID=183418 RepID=UPI001CC4255D|nr:uncharacterized protein LOC122719152 [Apis laboriosa]